MTKRIRSVLREQGALLALAAVCLFASIRYEAFLTPENLMNVVRQNSMLGIMALGMTFVILTGGIDLSAGALLAVAGVIAANLTSGGLVVASTAAITATALLGLLNGVIVASWRLPPFIVTLAMMSAARGLALAATDEQSVGVSRSAKAFLALGRGDLAGVPTPVIVLGTTYALGWLVLRHTAFGRHVYAVGDNEEAARLMGLNVHRIKVAVYTLSGALAGLAGVILASRLGAGQPVAGAGWELDAIASVVVGGTLLTGGEGSAVSTLAGVFLLGVIFNIFNLEGTISPWWQWVLRGLFLLIVVITQSRMRRSR